jgi:N-acetylglucosaminyl-diphospho-decaprenol L-rhamnosyltransferase
MRIAVISVLYGRGPRQRSWASALDRARDSLGNGAGVDFITVDNTGGTEDLGPLPEGASVIRLGRNVGFAAGCNRALQAAAGADTVVLLNPDVEVDNRFLAGVAELDWPDDLAARGPTILTPEGGVEQSARSFPTARTGVLGRTSLVARVWPSSPMVRRELQAAPDSGTREVDWVTGACLIAPRDRFESVGPLDEGYFLYWEDADWCRRARDAGMRVEYEPVLTVVHHQGSSSVTRPLMTIVAFHRSALRYWRLHVSQSRPATALAALALSGRCAIKLAGAIGRLAKAAGGR